MSEQTVAGTVAVCGRRFNGFIAQFMAGCFVPLKWITFLEEDFLRSSSGLMLGWLHAGRLNLVITEFRKVTARAQVVSGLRGESSSGGDAALTTTS